MKPNYIARTSIWSKLKLRTILLWALMYALIVPLYLFGWELLVEKLNLAIVFFAIFAVLLFVPIVWFVMLHIIVKNRYLEFYNDKIIQRWGVLNKNEHSTIFMGVTGTSLRRPFRGRILGYGHVKIDCAGKWDFDALYVKNPYRLVRYLRTKVIQAGESGKLVHI